MVRSIYRSPYLYEFSIFATILGPIRLHLSALDPRLTTSSLDPKFRTHFTFCDEGAGCGGGRKDQVNPFT